MSLVLAVIPARAGSKGVPEKNKRVIAGLSLVQWSIKAVMESTLVTDAVISTDDPGILECPPGRWGDTFQILPRPPELATDEASLDAVLIHVVDALKFEGLVVLLQPTVPLRRPGLVDDCIRAMEYRPGRVQPGSAITVNKLHFVWEHAFEGFIKQVNLPRVNRQDIKQPFYEEDGSVFVVHSSMLRATGGRVVAPVLPVVTERTVDIDTEDDMRLAESLLAGVQAGE